MAYGSIVLPRRDELNITIELWPFTVGTCVIAHV